MAGCIGNRNKPGSGQAVLEIEISWMAGCIGNRNKPGSRRVLFMTIESSRSVLSIVGN